MAARRGIADPFPEDSGSGLGELSGRISRILRHMLEDLKQTPAFALVALGGEGSFPLKIDVIDKRIASPRRTCQALEILSNLFPFDRGGFRQQFGKRLVEAADQKLDLEIDRIGQKPPELAHFG